MRQVAHLAHDAKRSDRTGDQYLVLGSFTRLAGDFDAAMVQLSDSVSHPELRKFVAIGAEGVRFNELRASFDVGLVDAKNRLPRAEEFSSSTERCWPTDS